MPNNVTTRCKVIGPDEEIQRFKDIFAGTQIMDFNRIIPMPDCLKQVGESSNSQQAESLVIIASRRGYTLDKTLTNDVFDFIDGIRKGQNLSNYELANRYLKEHPDVEAIGKQRLKNIVDHGFPTWYGWALKNWGTKWNAYNFAHISEDPYEFIFDTAWTFPEPIFVKLAELYPELTFSCACFDEGGGFAGKGYFNPKDDNPTFTYCDATDEMYELVYGCPLEPYDEDDEDDE